MKITQDLHNFKDFHPLTFLKRVRFNMKARIYYFLNSNIVLS